MTMSVMDNIMASNLQNKENTELNEPSAVAIGTEFARQYYTLLADSPKSVHKFYSHESTLQMNDISAVGQEKIGRAIENLVGTEKWRIKVVSIKGNMTLNQGIALQVFGEIGVTDTKRRFIQTFILGPQGSKKYYVQHDFFYFIEEVFASSKDSPSPTVSTPTPVTIEKTVPATPTVNGHKQVEVPPKSEAPPPVPAPAPQPIVEKPKPVVTEAAPAPVPAPTEERPVPKRQPKKEEKKKDEPPKQEAPPAPAPVDNTPKTWAKMVGASSKATVTTVTPSGAPAPQPKPVQPKAAPPAPKPTTPKQTIPNGPPHPNKCSIHVAGIVRTTLPENTSVAETEVRQIFSQWGIVENVSFPRAALDQRDVTKPTFAFIQMKNMDGVKAVLDAAEKTERGSLHLNIQVPSFGFDGEVTVSEQRERPPFSHRGGRGFRGRGARGGGFRGGYSNNSNGQH